MRDIANNLDTSIEVEELKFRLLASLSPEERFERMNRLCAFGKLIMLEGLREKHSQLSENELKIMLARNLWGDKFAEHVSLHIGENNE